MCENGIFDATPTIMFGTAGNLGLGLGASCSPNGRSPLASKPEEDYISPSCITQAAACPTAVAQRRLFPLFWRIAFFLPFLLLLVLAGQWLHPVAAHPQPAGATYQLYLPFLIQPASLPPSPEASLLITPDSWYTASTYEPGSFRLSNASHSQADITAVTIDLRTAVFPDMVFDPDGIAGDLVAKDVFIDSNGHLTGYAGRQYSSPHDDGYDVLTLFFTDFNPGETMSFSVDVDPTSIRGVPAPGPYETGSVSGLELVGSTVTVHFGDTAVTAFPIRQPGSVSGSLTVARSHLPPPPTVTVEGIVGHTAVVTEAQQTLHIQTEPWHRVKILIIEGGLFTDGLPGGGHDIQPFEVNTALHVYEYNLVSGPGHSLTVPITLSRTHANGGYNIISVTQANGFGYHGQPANPIILQLQD